MNAQVKMDARMFIGPAVVYFVNSADVDWTDPQALLCVRAAFGACMLGILVLYAYIYSLVSRSADERRVKIKEKKQFGVVQEEAREVSVMEYDLETVGKNIKTALITVCITMFLHSKYQYILPMVIQVVMQPIQAYSNPLFKIHILKERDTGASNPLSRPWRNAAPGGIGEMWSQAQAMQDRTKLREEERAKKAERKKVKELARGGKGR